MRSPQRPWLRVPGGAITPKIIVGNCRACAYTHGARLALPTHRDDAPDGIERWVDEGGWVHDHPVTPETEHAADQLFPKGLSWPPWAKPPAGRAQRSRWWRFWCWE